MDQEKLILTPKPKGEDEHRTFSIRVPKSTLLRIEDFAAKTGRNRNEVINIFLEYSLKHCVVTDEDSEESSCP